jgi:ATP synthase protein I
VDGRLDHRARGRRLALRFAGLQLGCAGVVALIAFATSGAAAGRAALAGGLVVAVGNVLFGWTLFAPGVAPVRLLARAVFAGELLKWLWVAIGLWLALGPARMAPLPLVLGLVAAQLGFWLGLALIR